MKYVALLRGINVGGNNTIKMSELKTCFEQVGFSDVSTYINSGNIIFTDKTNSEIQLITIIEKCIRDNLNLDIPVLVRNANEIKKLVHKLPQNWTNDGKMRTDVLFLWTETDHPGVIEEIKTNPDVDKLIYTKGAVIWNIERLNYTKSKFHNFIGTKIYKQMTARNVNTVRKLHTLMNG